MNFNVLERKHEMNVAKLAMDAASIDLDLAASATNKAHEKLNALPAKGYKSWFNGGARKTAKEEHEAAKAEQENYSLALDEAMDEYNDAFNAHAEAVKLQKVADLAAFEADQVARKEVMAAADRILPTQLVKTVGRRSVKRLEILDARERKIADDKRSVAADLHAAGILGYTGEVAE